MLSPRRKALVWLCLIAVGWVIVYLVFAYGDRLFAHEEGRLAYTLMLVAAMGAATVRVVGYLFVREKTLDELRGRPRQKRTTRMPWEKGAGRTDAPCD